MSLADLYQEVIMDHYGRPRNRGTIADADVSFELKNPVCGDVIRVDAALEGDTVRDIRFSGQGCSISQASASMMTQLVQGKNLEEARRLIDCFLAMMRGEQGDYRALGEAQALQGVTKYPVRVKCAALAWHVLEEGLRRRAAGGESAAAGSDGEADGARRPGDGGGRPHAC